MFKYRNDNNRAMFVENTSGESTKLKPGEVWNSSFPVMLTAGLTVLTPSGRVSTAGTSAEKKAKSKPKKEE